MLRRITRIYPPYLLAVVFFAATRLLKASMGGTNDLRRPLVVWLQNLTLTQWITDLYHPVIEPAQNRTLFVAAFWSLNYEEQFYLVMALAVILAASRRISLVASVVGLAIMALAWNWIAPPDQLFGIFIEYWVHFALGACLFFVLTQSSDGRTRAAFVIIVALIGLSSFASVLAHGVTGTADSLRAMTELGFLSVVTLSLFLLRPLSPAIARSVFWRPLALLGLISYSLYLIHQFNLTLVASVAQRLLPVHSSTWLLVPVEIVLFLLLATVFWWCCERPFIHRQPGPEPAGTHFAEASSSA